MTRTADERIALNDLAGGGVTPFAYADGSCGIRGVDGATALPSALTLAATFDPVIAEEYGALLADELLASGHNVLLAPALDIARDPRSGRLGENLGEDPLLAGELGGRMGRGIQQRGALAVAKHFVGNNIELRRTGEGSFGERTDAIDVRADERTLHEVYLAPFRRAVQDYGVAGLLGSYNRLNGEYACQSRFLLQLPREQWGFRGVTVPDFLFGVRDAEAALAAGLDIPGLDELAGRTEDMVTAADRELLAGVSEHVRAAVAQVGLVAASGVADPAGLGTCPALALAERVAIDGAVLLRNHEVLPFASGTRIALIGADEIAHRLVVGGAASVTLSSERIPDLDHELEAAGIRVVATAPGLANLPLPPLTATDGVELSAVIRDGAGERLLSLRTAELRASDDDPGASWSAVLTAVLPSDTGTRVIAVEFAGNVEVYFDGRRIAAGFREASPMIAGPHYVLQALVPATGSKPSRLEVRYRTGPAIAVPGTPIVPHLIVGAAPLDATRSAALAAASGVDAVVMLAGRVTGEAMDAESLELPAGQAELIDALAATGVPVVVVTHGAGPIVMPWRERVGAILHVGHPGERFAPALAAMLSGRHEPGGRLALTVPAEDPPVRAAAPDPEGRLFYEEGVDVGYRGYERAGVEPAYWFGHGLGYAAIDLRAVSLDTSDVMVRLACGSDRGGKAVVQLYARKATGETLALVGFAPVRLHAGEERTVRVRIDRDAVCRWADGWVAPEGELRVHVGFSRGDLRAALEVEIP